MIEARRIQFPAEDIAAAHPANGMTRLRVVVVQEVAIAVLVPGTESAPLGSPHEEGDPVRWQSLIEWGATWIDYMQLFA